MNDAAHPSHAGLAANLRQMIAVLENERQALAALDADDLHEATRTKEALCNALEPVSEAAMTPEARELAQTAQRLNDVNRRVRNLLAANVSARIEALGGTPRSAYAAQSAIG